MMVFEGSSSQTNARDAVQEATRGWASPPDIVFAFHSSKQDSDAVAAALVERLPGTRIAGCTSAGEHLTGRHSNGSLVVAGIASPRTRWSVTVLEDLAHFDAAHAVAARDRLLAGLGRSVEDLDPTRHFCICFADGLSLKEEPLAASMAEALLGVPLVGGSAGDDLQFQRTRVLADGRAYDNAATLVLAESDDGFRVIKHQHFVPTRRYLAVTRVDAERRRVIELDGLPAAEAYARATGVPREQFTADLAFSQPLTFQCNGELYVRSVQSVAADGSISLYCAIEEGMVLSVGDHLPMDRALEDDLGSGAGDARFLLACNCILRSLEAEKADKHEALGSLLRRLGKTIVGFDTYGEQLNGLHINQTLVGLAIGVGSGAA